MLHSLGLNELGSRLAEPPRFSRVEGPSPPTLQPHTCLHVEPVCHGGWVWGWRGEGGSSLHHPVGLIFQLKQSVLEGEGDTRLSAPCSDTTSCDFVSSFCLMLPQLTMNDFSVHRIIGRGGFGEVYGCRKADTGKM